LATVLIDNQCTNKVTFPACEAAGQQIAVATGGAVASDTTVNLLISNVEVLNVNTELQGSRARGVLDLRRKIEDDRDNRVHYQKLIMCFDVPLSHTCSSAFHSYFLEFGLQVKQWW
jgi:hypothetical protein